MVALADVPELVAVFGKHVVDDDASDDSWRDTLDGLVVDKFAADECCPDEAGQTGVGRGWEAEECSVTLLLFLSEPAGVGARLGTRINDKDLTDRWCASVARAFSVRKKKYWMMIGVRERKLDVTDADLSIRAQVR